MYSADTLSLDTIWQDYLLLLQENGSTQAKSAANRLSDLFFYAENILAYKKAKDEFLEKLHRNALRNWPKNESEIEIFVQSGKRKSGIAISHGERYITQNRPKKDPTRKKLTYEMIKEWIKEDYNLRSPQRFAELKDEILYGPYKGKTWKQISVYMSQGKNGLPKNNTKTFLQLKHEVAKEIGIAYQDPRAVYKENLSYPQIKGWILDHFRETGKIPANKDTVICGEYKGKKWDSVHRIILDSHRGLPKGPEQKTLLDLKLEVIEENGLKVKFNGRSYPQNHQPQPSNHQDEPASSYAQPHHP
jgi:hypothetical protein